jgi:ketosteroid isomerase-like protein
LLTLEKNELMKLIAFVLMTLPIFAQTNNDVSEIKSVLQTQEKLWNEGKIEEFMEYYSKSEDLKFIGKSGVTKGWGATLKRYQTSYPNRETMGTLSFDIQEIDVTAGQTAWVLGRWNLKRPSLGDVGGYFTLLIKKIDGRWLVVRDHTS